MAWSFDAGHLVPGASIRWAFWWGGEPHQYQGIQVIQAKPRRASGIVVLDSATLRVSSSELKMELDGGYTYFITVTNLEGNWYFYDIVGAQVG